MAARGGRLDAFSVGNGEGKENAVRAEEGQVQVYDEKGRKTEAPKGSGITLGVGTDKEHTLSSEEFAKLAETDPELHRQLSGIRQGGNVNFTPSGADSRPDVKPIHTKEAGTVLNEMYKVLHAHAAGMRSSSSPRADKLSDNPIAAEIHGKVMQHLSDARTALTSGDEARRGKLDPSTNTVKPDQAYANKQYKSAFSKIKEAHNWLTHPGLTQAGVPASPISEGSISAIGARFSHKDSLPTLNTRKSSKLVVVGNTAHFIGDGGEESHDPEKVARARAAGMTVKFMTESEARDRGRELNAGVKAGLPAAGAAKFNRRITGKVYKKEVREGSRSPQIGFVPGQDPGKKTPQNRVIESSPRIHGTSPGATPKFDATSAVEGGDAGMRKPKKGAN